MEMPERIEIDISGLEELDQGVRVSASGGSQGLSRLAVRHVSHGAAVQYEDIGRSVSGGMLIAGGDKLPGESK